MSDEQTIEPFETVFADYPPSIPGATPNVVSEDPNAVQPLVGMPLRLTESDLLTVVVDPTLDQPGNPITSVVMHLNGLRLDVEPIIDDQLRRTYQVPSHLLREGLNLFHYLVERTSGNSAPSLPLSALYSYNKPGGYDLAPGDNYHDGLDIALPREIIEQGIGKEQAAKGVPVTLAYSHMKAHDIVTLKLNGHDVTHKVLVAEVGAPIVFVVTQKMLEEAGDDPEFHFVYRVQDQLGNYTERSLWSIVIKVDVYLQETLLAAASFAENPEDESDDPDTIDRGKLGTNDLSVLVYVAAPQWRTGDTISMAYYAKPASGDEDEHLGEKVVGRVPFLYTLPVPNAKVPADSRARVSYKQVRDGVHIGRSALTFADVIGEAGPSLKAPRVEVSDGVTLDPANNPNGATAIVEFTDAHTGDKARLIVKGQPGDGSPAPEPVPIVNQRAVIPLTVAFMHANANQKVVFQWQLLRASNTFPSPTLTLNVLEQTDLVGTPRFKNEPYQAGAGGLLGDIVLELVDANSAPVSEGTLSLTLPVGFTFTGGEGGTQTFKTDATGLVMVSGVRAGNLGAYNLTAASGGKTATAAVQVTDGPLAVIPVGAGPTMLVISPDGKRVYVANAVGNSISVIDTTANAVVETITLAGYIFNLCITPSGGHLYVLASVNRSGYVQVVSTATNKVVKNFSAGSAGAADYGGQLTTSKNGQEIYVYTSSNTMNGIKQGFYVIDDAQQTISQRGAFTDVVAGSAGMVLSADGSHLYVFAYAGNNFHPHLIFIIAVSGQRTVRSWNELFSQLVPRGDGSTLYAASGSSVWVLEPQNWTAIHRIPLGGPAEKIVLSPDEKLMYVNTSLPNGDSVSVFDINSRELIKTLRGGRDFYGFAISPDGTRLWGCNTQGNSVTVLAVG